MCFILTEPLPWVFSTPGNGTSWPCFFINASTTVYVEWIQQYVFKTSSGMSLQKYFPHQEKKERSGEEKGEMPLTVYVHNQ